MNLRVRKGLDERHLSVYGRSYRVFVRRQVVLPVSAPRLVIVAYQPNDTARDILRLCIDAINRFTSEPHELWVIDNCSPQGHLDWLLKMSNLNVVLNRGASLTASTLLGRFLGHRE